MGLTQLEKLRRRVEDSLEDNKSICREVDRAAAINDIKLIVGKFVTICQTRHRSPEYRKISEAWTLFADRPDSTLELEENGVYAGISHIRAWFEAYYEAGPFVGVMYERDLASPQIVVAGDGQSARGVWEVIGFDTDPRCKESGSREGAPAVMWNWGAVRADLLKIDGQWKIWHYHYYQRLNAPFYRSWADYEKKAAVSGPFRDRPGYAGQNLPAPDAPPTYHNVYSTQTVQLPIPPAPEPYDTWPDTIDPA
jgi:hypothetical protein